jgi:hypothetical protein
MHARLCRLSIGTGTMPCCQMRTCSPDGEESVASSQRVLCCVMHVGKSKQGLREAEHRLGGHVVTSRERGDAGRQKRASHARQV